MSTKKAVVIMRSSISRLDMETIIKQSKICKMKIVICHPNEYNINHIAACRGVGVFRLVNGCCVKVC